MFWFMLWLRVKQIFFSAIILAILGAIFWGLTHHFIKVFKYYNGFPFEIFPVAIAVGGVMFLVLLVLKDIWGN